MTPVGASSNSPNTDDVSYPTATMEKMMPGLSDIPLWLAEVVLFLRVWALRVGPGGAVRAQAYNEPRGATQNRARARLSFHSGQRELQTVTVGDFK